MTKTCLICGAEFEAPVNNAVYCSSCQEEARNARLASYYRIHKGMIDDCIGDGIYAKEWKRQLPPTQEDIDDVRMLLKEFGINTKNNLKFTTFAELDTWKKNQLNAALS